MKFAKLLAAACLALSMTGCAYNGTYLKLMPPNAATGYFPANPKAKKPEILVDKKVDLKAYKSFAVTSEPYGEGTFLRDSVRSIAVFDEVMNMQDLTLKIVQAGLQDKVPTLRDKIGVSNAYRHYRKFLWLQLDMSGNPELTVIDPSSMEELFKARVISDYSLGFTGTDQDQTYPLLNALVDWTRKNQ